MDTMPLYFSIAAAASFSATITSIIALALSGEKKKKISHGDDSNRPTLEMQTVAQSSSEEVALPEEPVARIDNPTTDVLEFSKPATEEVPSQSITNTQPEESVELSTPSPEHPVTAPHEDQAVPVSATFILIAEKGADNRSWRLEQDSVVLGRSPDVECPVPSLTVSRRHAKIEKREEGYYLSDMGSKNGTFLNGERVVSPTIIKPGDKIEIGEIDIRVTIEAE